MEYINPYSDPSNRSSVLTYRCNDLIENYRGFALFDYGKGYPEFHAVKDGVCYYAMDGLTSLKRWVDEEVDGVANPLREGFKGKIEAAIQKAKEAKRSRLP